MASFNRRVESTPPEYATSTEPSPRTISRAVFNRFASNASSWIITPARLARAGFGRLHRGGAAPGLVVDQRVDRGVLSAQGASFVRAQLQLAEAHVLAFEKKVATDHRPVAIDQVVDRLDVLSAAVVALEIAE